MSRSPLLETRQLSIEIEGKRLCRELDLQIQPGECWAILGQNGTGKTTLLHTLAGLNDIQSGQVLLEGTPLSSIPRKQFARQCGLLLQDYQDVFPASVLQAVLSGRHPHLSAWQWESEQDYQVARRALADMGLAGFEQRQLQSLSGGERRRVAIAAILAQQPRLYLLDEPVNHLDIKHQQQILGVFSEMTSGSEQAVIMVLHDINLAARYCSHVLMMYEDGRVESGRCQALLSEERLSELYDYPILKQDGETVGFMPK